MYTRHKAELGKLRAYHEELTERYHGAVQRRDWTRARALYTRRHRVWVAIRWYEEWDGHPPALPTGQPAVSVTAG